MLPLNDITTIDGRIFDGMPELIRVVMMSNRLVSLPPSIDRCTNLVRIDVGGNELTSLPPLASLTAMYSLNLATNRLREIPSWIGSLSQLARLDIHNMRPGLTAVPWSALSKLRRLEIFIAESNNITDLRYEPDVLDLRFPRLRVFDMSENNISAISPTSINLLSQSLYAEEAIVDLANNNITSWIPPPTAAATTITTEDDGRQRWIELAGNPVCRDALATTDQGDRQFSCARHKYQMKVQVHGYDAISHERIPSRAVRCVCPPPANQQGGAAPQAGQKLSSAPATFWVGVGAGWSCTPPPERSQAICEGGTMASDWPHCGMKVANKDWVGMSASDRERKACDNGKRTGTSCPQWDYRVVCGNGTSGGEDEGLR